MKVAINGFGRIGRQILHIIMQGDKDLEVVAINDLTDNPTLAHLFEFDSTYGRYPGTVESRGEEALIVDGKEIKTFAERDPAQLPWSDLGVDLVFECTGVFRTKEKASLHLKAGAKKVIVSAPCKGDEPVPTVVMGVNEEILTGEETVISNASCTTNCLAPVAKVLNESFGIKRGIMTTIHAATNDQKILDLPHSDLRRARSTLQSMIPTSTGAAKAVGLVIPELKGKLTGMAVRVPLPTVSLVDLTVELGKETTVEEINKAFEDYSKDHPKILKLENKPVVSKDFQQSPISSTVDAQNTMVLDGNMAKILAWYDNEWGYSCRMVDLAEYISNK